jgi:hypothetical protein
MFKQSFNHFLSLLKVSKSLNQWALKHVQTHVWLAAQETEVLSPFQPRYEQPMEACVAFFVCPEPNQNPRFLDSYPRSIRFQTESGFGVNEPPRSKTVYSFQPRYEQPMEACVAFFVCPEANQRAVPEGDRLYRLAAGGAELEAQDALYSLYFNTANSRRVGRFVRSLLVESF